MLGPTILLTLATLAGLVAGFAREWLLIADWGSGARSDAFLIAMFLPEAVRMAMANGLLGGAALPLYQQRDPAQRAAWLQAQTLNIGMLGVALTVLLLLGAPLFTRLIGPGLTPASQHQATVTLRMLAWTMPGICLQSLWSVPLQAESRFVRAGLGSLLYNLPAVLVLLLHRHAVDENELGRAFIFGSVLMSALLLPALWRHGWRPWHLRFDRTAAGELYRRLLPLLVSSGASQGLALVERICASLLGPGAVTVLNLARKLVNLPLIALMSLNQVLLSLLGGASEHRRRLDLLRRGLAMSTLLTLPAAVLMIGAAPTLVATLLPHGLAHGPLPGLLAWFAGVIVFGSWNAMLARYGYAAGDTRTPMRCELAGSVLNVLALLALPRWLGLPGIALAALLGVVLTGALLLRAFRLFEGVRLPQQWLVSTALLLGSALMLYPLGQRPWLQGGLALVAGLLAFIAFAAWLKPWRSTPHASP